MKLYISVAIVGLSLIGLGLLFLGSYLIWTRGLGIQVVSWPWILGVWAFQVLLHLTTTSAQEILKELQK